MRRRLSTDWELCSSPPGRISRPDDPVLESQDWIATGVPSTAASSLRAAGRWSLDSPVRNFDGEDWWYRLRFACNEQRVTVPTTLVLEGLVTSADVWLNKRHVLNSENMFLAHRIRVDDILTDNNELLIRFRSLTALLAAKRARPRWRVPMIEQQQLRWHRTTLLGRTPGWSPPAAAVGPWQPIWLEDDSEPFIESTRLDATLRDGIGVVAVSLKINGTTTPTVEFVLQGSGQAVRGTLVLRAPGTYSGEICVENPLLWWPHTHGDPVIYQASIELGDAANRAMRLAVGGVGFRAIELNAENGNFMISVNALRIFCRGACWTPLDPVSLQAAPEQYDIALTQLRDAGMNMIRVGGTMVYECDAFYQACDRLGILVWQDFMFASMDYPGDDPAFLATTAKEADQVLMRLGKHPSVALFCGNSEVEQQAAMCGAPREHWYPSFFHSVLADKVREHCPNTPYWPSSAHGGAFPHDGSAGTTSYYGVGAYLRPLEDSRRAEIRFASECLAFANVPEASTLQKMPGGTAIRVHHPEWKARSPRDLGAGWDFDDVRDYYLRLLYDVDPLQLRYSNHDRYLALSRAVSGEVMAAAFGEWRRNRSSCSGALIWFLRDLWAGAGWGIIDSLGQPKAAYFYLRRVLQPVAVIISDEGGNGLRLHVINERPTALQADLRLTLYRSGNVKVADARIKVDVACQSGIDFSGTNLLEGFHDLSYAYRFGPASYEVAVAALYDDQNKLLGSSFHFPLGRPIREDSDPAFSATASPIENGKYLLTLEAERFAYAVSVHVDGYTCEDQHFNLLPGTERTLVLKPTGEQSTRLPRGHIQALNTAARKTIDLRT